MPKLTAGNLRITKNRKLRTVKAKASVAIDFDDFDRLQLSQGLRFELQAALWGQDGPVWYPFVSFVGRGNDDHLYDYPRLVIDSPEQRELTLIQTFGEDGVLDEDGGKDEIYARFRLLNLSTDTVVSETWSNLEDWGHF